jgi:hypothetical protein
MAGRFGLVMTGADPQGTLAHALSPCGQSDEPIYLSGAKSWRRLGSTPAARLARTWTPAWLTLCYWSYTSKFMRAMSLRTPVSLAVFTEWCL